MHVPRGHCCRCRCCEDIDVLQREDVDKSERSLVVSTGGYRRVLGCATVLEHVYLTQNALRVLDLERENNHTYRRNARH